jgi:hypothetical protein
VRDVQGEGERRRQAERIRAETNSRIAEILTPEQRPAWERLLAESGARGQAATAACTCSRRASPSRARCAWAHRRLDHRARRRRARRGHGSRHRHADARGSASQPAGGGLPRPRFF